MVARSFVLRDRLGLVIYIVHGEPAVHSSDSLPKILPGFFIKLNVHITYILSYTNAMKQIISIFVPDLAECA